MGNLHNGPSVVLLNFGKLKVWETQNPVTQKYGNLKMCALTVNFGDFLSEILVDFSEGNLIATLIIESTVVMLMHTCYCTHSNDD